MSRGLSGDRIQRCIRGEGGAPALFSSSGTCWKDHCVPSELLSISLCPESRVTLTKHSNLTRVLWELSPSITLSVSVMRYASQSIATIQYIEDTYKAASDAIRFTPVTMQCDLISFQHNAIRCNGKIWSLLFIWFRQTANHKLTYVSSDF